MFKEFCYIFTIGIISYFYNLYIYPIIINKVGFFL